VSRPFKEKIQMFKTLIVASALLAAASAGAQPQVGVSIGISQPGVYGRIEIGNFPPPVLVYPQPVIIAAPPAQVLVQRRPIYLYVPPGHQKNWAKHCGRYGACGQPVYFVQESWVRERYEERRGQDDDKYRGKGKDKGEKHGKGKGHND
jgi:hypothetical protein